VNAKQIFVIEIDDDNDEALQLLYTRFTSDFFEALRAALARNFFYGEDNQRRKRRKKAKSTQSLFNFKGSASAQRFALQNNKYNFEP
jgi:hypothetical protein